MDPELIEKLKLCFDKSPEEAMKFLASEGVKTSWNWQEQLEIIKQHCFTVAKVGNADVLQLIHEEILKAVDDGKSYKDFKDELSQMFQEKGYLKRDDGSAWRLDTIFRTNMQSAYMGGRYFEMQNVKDDFPYWQYIAIRDNRTRASHSELAGKVVRMDDNFWKTHYPPNGYRCRCRVRALGEQDLTDKKLKVTDGDSLKDNKPDDGFETNPGEQLHPKTNGYYPKLKKYLERALKDE